MAGLIRTLFKSKKSKKEEQVADDIVPCSANSQRKLTARFADDSQLSATAAYHTETAPRLRKGPQSCPGGYQEESLDQIMPGHFKKRKHNRQDFSIDVDPRRSHPDLLTQHRLTSNYRSRRDYDSDSDENDEPLIRKDHMYERKSQFFLQKWENSERQRREDRRIQEQLEKERASIQNAMSNMAYCMASLQQMEQLKKERDQYRKEMSKYKNKCERLESKCEQLKTMSPNFNAFQSFQPPIHQPSPYQTPHFPQPQFSQSNNFSPALPMRSNFAENIPIALHRSTNFLSQAPSFVNNNLQQSSFNMANTPTTIGSDGAGESLSNPSDISFMRPQFPELSSLVSENYRAQHKFYDNEDMDEVKNFREEDSYSRTFSQLSQSTSSTHDELV